jgi:predicted lipoprotein with Yx(FWY)xxD motif
MKNFASTGLNRFTAVTLALVLFLGSSSIALAAPGAKAMTAEIIVSGANSTTENPSVLLNGEQAISGRTFQSSGLITTSDKGSALINLGKLGRVQVSSGSTFNLTIAENSISGELTAGQINVINNEGVAVSIRTLNSVATSNGTESGNLLVDANTGATQTKDDDDKGAAGAAGAGGGYWVPILVFAGIVGGVTAVVLTTRDDDALAVVSPIR